MAKKRYVVTVVDRIKGEQVLKAVVRDESIKKAKTRAFDMARAAGMSDIVTYVIWVGTEKTYKELMVARNSLF